ncbi:hypothetical protein [Bradyrhizobium australafricanum]|uniref:hypothetical protein n=1 Tax=Bradyrhizobium australafricanum TaxID=2821406 RepID=UPI001CE2A908|nr:hypothetical protein [Bradyrhizobium australafricanum]MCA6098875.1 hypothetical protein [Bradyrhizobium australafricanum]
MVQRFLAGGPHPALGTMGVWLSRDGVDVTTATANSDFLLRPETKNDQIVLSGSIYLPIGSGTQTILYPATFTKAPYVWFQAYTISGQAMYPSDLNMTANAFTSGGILFYEAGMALTFQNDRISMNNTTDNNNFTVDYMIFYRSIGA